MIGFRRDQIIYKVQAIGKGDFSDDLNVRGNDEISDLAAALNRMCKQLMEKRDNDAEKRRSYYGNST